MSITAAAIEANGWVLALTMTAARSTVGDFSLYALDPNGAQRLTLTGQGPGFVQSGGQAVATPTDSRTLIATKTLRLPVQATAAGARAAKTPDEADVVAGTSFVVRIALSKHVYSTGINMTLNALAGWRTGEGAATIAVTNNSTILAPSPIVRWADVPYQHISNSRLIDLEVVAFSHHPRGFAPIAGVKFTVTDGTNTATGWATALTSSPKYGTGGTGVAVRVYRVTIDGGTASPAALTEGLIRADFKAFPWVGTARASDTTDTALAAVASNGTPSMTNLQYAGMAPAAQSPFVVAYDPNGTWLPTLYVYIQPNTWSGTGSITSNVLTVASTVSGAVAIGTKISGVGVTAGCTVVSGADPTWTVTTTGGVGTIALQGGGTSNNNIVTVNASPTTAANGTCADSYITARNAFKIQNRVVGARNGQPASASGATDGMVIRYKAGTYVGLGTNSVGTGISTNYTWEIAEGDPADANPRVNVIVGQAAGGNARASRTLFRNMTILGSTAAVAFGRTTYGWADNVEIRGQTGFESNGIGIFDSTVTNTFWTNLRYWKLGNFIGGQLNRNCEVVAPLGGSTSLNCARLSTAAGQGITSGVSSVDPFGSTQDLIAAGNDLRYIKSTNIWSCGTTANASAGATALGTSYSVFNRIVFANNTCEQYGASFPTFIAIGENATVVATYTIVEGNTIVGDRTNWLYDDLNLGTIALNDTESNIMYCNRFANNVVDQHSIKHDFFNDPYVASQRGGTSAYGFDLATSRSKGKGVGAELTTGGNVYHCITAGTTASSGGPTGTGSDITDGSVHWAWFATEVRQHGYRPNAVRGWSALYGVGMADNIILRGNPSAEFLHEFEGLNTPNYSVDTGSNANPKFTLDKSGTDLSGQYDPANIGGGNYKPLPGSPLIGHSSTSPNIDVDQRGVTRATVFSTGGIEADPGTALLPNSATLPLADSTGALTASAVLATSAGALAITGTVTALAASAAPLPATGTIALAGSVATLSARAAITGATGTVALLGSTGLLSVGALTLLTPAGGSLALTGPVTTLRAGAGLVGDTGVVAAYSDAAPLFASAALMPATAQFGFAGSRPTMSGSIGRPPDVRVVMLTAA
ncbi:MAG: hypothetical protein ACRYG4_04110 [Janthinobacterium lividum]